MISWFIDQIPLWVYIAVALLIAAPLLYFFGPILAAVWRVMPNGVKIAFGAIAALLSAYVLGRNKAAKNAKEEQKRRDARAVQTRQEVHDDVQKLNRADTDKRLDRWMRD